MTNFLRRMNSKSASTSASSSSDIDFSDNQQDLTIRNSEEINISQIEQRLHNWTIPKQNIEKIYQIGAF